MICPIVALLLPLTVHCRPNKKTKKIQVQQQYKCLKQLNMNFNLISLALGHCPENLNPLGGGRWWNSTIEHKLGMVRPI
jgi:hypothetical protein